MSKKNKHKKSVQTAAPAGTITMTPEQLKNVIAQAIVEAEQLKEQQHEKELFKKQEVWRKEIGLKDYSKQKGIFARAKSAFNIMVVFGRLGFCKMNVPSTQVFTSAFLALPVTGFFYFIDWMLKLLSLLLILAAFKSSIFTAILLVTYAFLSFMISVMFKLIGKEIENNTDANYLFTVFSALVAFISLILSLYTLWKG